MTRRSEFEQNFFMSGLWYYQVRALPIAPLIKEYGKRKAELLKQLELLARVKWKNPTAVAWDIDDFRNMMYRLGLSKVAEVYRGNAGLPVIIPRTTFFYDAFSSYPNLNTVYGDRGSGKTIFAWVTAWEVFKRNYEKYDEFQIYVYGDIDGLAKEVQKYHPESHFRKSIIIMEDYEAPEPEKGVGKFIIYNELDESLMDSNAMKKETKARDRMIFRSRHYQYWMFYNIIRLMRIGTTIRISSSFQSYKPLSQNLLAEIIEKGIPSYFRPVFLQAIARLKYTESLASIPLYRSDKMKLKTMGSRQTFTITPIPFPKWLEKATKTAVENFDVGAILSAKKQNEIIKLAAELYIKGKSVREIARIMKSEHKFDRHYTWYSTALANYFSQFGYENLKEVRKDVKMGSIFEKIHGREGEAAI